MELTTLREVVEHRPKKEVFPIKTQKLILKHVKRYVKKRLPPKTKSYIRRLFGSIVKHNFGRYEKPWKNRIYSHINVLFVVDDDFQKPNYWHVHFIPKGNTWTSYKVGHIELKLNGKDIRVDIEYVIVKLTKSKEKKVITYAESMGIPLKKHFSRNIYKSI
ncbi:hypothetical protein ACFL1H_04475 [Nanoarchaeota archaeon]